ncbi:MAG TPA: hypothetical protein VGI39_32865 [Polyangiaceae bacterium]
MHPLRRGLPVLAFALPLAGCISDDSAAPPTGCVTACVDASFPGVIDAGGTVTPDATVGDSAAPDAQSDATPGFDAGEDATTTDSSAPDDAGSDAATTDSGTDAGAADDAGSDAATTDSGSDAGAPDAAPSFRPCVVDLDGGTNTFLISDPGTGHIDQVTMTGTVLQTYTAPMSNVAGVAFDRRARDGFWVVGTNSGNSIAKIAWSGAALPSLTTTRSYGNLRGLDYCLGTTAADDTLDLVDTNSNALDTFSGSLVSTGAFQFEMGFSAPSGFQSGYWGVSVLATDITANVLRGWFARASSLELWQTSTQQGATVTMGVSDPRGLVLAPNGDFWVVDATAHKVVHLSSDGTTLGGFATPGTQPAGLSFDPGP